MNEQDRVNENFKDAKNNVIPATVRFFSSKDIQEMISMKKAISLMGKAFISLSAGHSKVPKRYVTEFGEQALKVLLKPSYSIDIERCGIKVLTQKEKDPSLNLPAIMGIMLLIDAKTGEFLSIMDGASITALRTGAASGIATKYLARENSRVVAIFGCGVQGKAQLEAICTVRNIRQVYVYDIKPQEAKTFIKEMQPKIKANIHFTDDLNLLSSVDIICTATGSETPLFKLSHIKEGVHINAIGSFQPHMQEIDPHIIKACRLFADQKSSSFFESGDLYKPINDKIITKNHLVGEIGEVFMENKDGRTSNKDITLFKSVGVAVQDLAVANEVYNKAKDQLSGKKLEL